MLSSVVRSLSLAVLLLAVLLLPSAGSAEFLRTGLNTHQSADGKIKIINVSSKKLGTPGIFIYTGTSIDLQFFTPNDLSDDSAQHIFIEYDTERSRYSKLYLGDNELSIHGSFTLFLKSGLRITVDEQKDSPYLSIARDNPKLKAEPAILGFKGVTAIINEVGDKALALLEARSLSTVTRAVAPYEVSFSEKNNTGKLLIKGREVKTGRVGLALQQDTNICLQRKALYLAERELETLRKISSRSQKTQYLKRLIRNNTGTYLDLYDDLLFLRVTKDMVVSFNHKTNNVFVLKPVSDSSSQRQAICTVHRVELS